MPNEFDRGSFSPDDISQWFWDVVERAGRSRDRLKAELQSMTREEVIRFDNEFQEAAVQLVDEPFLDFMEGDVSEDSAKDIADFVVSQGKKVYSEIWANPETIPASVESGEIHTLAGIASEVFWDRFKESIPQEIDFS
jgi:hypothetical protein